VIASVPVPGRWCVAAAAVTTLGALVPVRVAVLGAAMAIGVATARPRFTLVGVVGSVLIVGGSVSAAAASSRLAAVEAVEVPAGTFEVEVMIREDPAPQWSWLAVGTPIAIDGETWRGPPLGIGPLPGHINAGDRVVVEGVMRDAFGRVGNDVVAGRLRVTGVVRHDSTANPLMMAGNGLRDRVRGVFDTDDPVDGLVSGLLMGDTDRIPSMHMENLRRAGLAHFVAVSGSNVALFLGVLWVLGAPLSIHPRTRALLGFVGLAVFVVMTRWEPSVVRASVMAAVPLTGGLLGVPVDPWMALGIAVTVLMLFSAELLTSVGFTLSVAATAGVLVGVAAVRHRSPRWLWTPLGATVGAQLAVAPIILSVFGTMPLIAPLANLVAAPIVTLTTLVSLVCVVIPVGLLSATARAGSAAILEVASIASDGPQLSAMGTIGAATVGVLAGVRRSRPLGIAAVAVILMASTTTASTWPSRATMVALAVGQGDSILLQDPSGRAVLVDGGRRPDVLVRALRRHRVSSLDVVVVTHGDSDHSGGLGELLGVMEVGEVWMPAFAMDEALDELALIASQRKIPVRRVAGGFRTSIGAFSIEVLGPNRRFLSDNDGSVVLLVTAGRSALLPGDIGAVAQNELPHVRPDVLVVPHHGAATSDLGWLERTDPDLAILSYGPNTYGHPHPDVVGVLSEMGTAVRHTDIEGDIVVPLG
jgi:competence protein ComEC